MCGIAGVWCKDRNVQISSSLAQAMVNSLQHRGPDQEGIFKQDGAVLGHRRLSIIDLASGAQPMFNEDQSVAVVYNGEIYNYTELMADLAKRGHHFRTRCDTEVIVHAWEEWGRECVNKFRGMFSFALWDRRKDLLFLARDRLGIKPLYYAQIGSQFLFASEIKAISLHPEFSRELDLEAVEEYFAYGYVPDPRSIYRAVRKLPPGCSAIVNRDLKISQERYWDIPFSGSGSARDEAEIRDELVERLREAVRIRLRSDVPLGAFLSGGVDSASVVAMMAGVMPDNVHTFSAGFDEELWDERRYAKAVAARYGCRHESTTIRSTDYRLFDTLCALYDEPFADSSALPTYLLSAFTRRHVTVALSGDGGDELFAGYRSYQLHMKKEQIRSAIPDVLRKPLFSALGWMYPKADWAPQVLRAKRTFQDLADDSLGSFASGNMITTHRERRLLFSEKTRQALQGYSAVEVLRRHVHAAPTDDALSLVQYLDMKVYLPADILTKVDRASMAHGLEVRVPLLDHHFVEWVCGLPPELKLRGGNSKYIFKRAMERYLEPEILHRRKMGFSIPLCRWLREPLCDAAKGLSASSPLYECGLFEPKFIRRVVREHLLGLREHGPVLWALLMFDSFLRRSQAADNAPIGQEEEAAYAA